MDKRFYHYNVLKTCNKCGITKPLTIEFFKFIKKVNRFESICKICNNEYAIEWRKKNPLSQEKRLQKQAYDRIKKKEFYQKHKKRLRQSLDKYNENHPEMYKESIRKWGKRNPDKLKQYHKAWTSKIEGRISVRLGIQNKKAKLYGVIHDFTRTQYIDKLKQNEGKCLICKQDVGIFKLTTDHILPMSKAPKGYIYTINDIQFICLSCNARKGDSLD